MRVLVLLSLLCFGCAFGELAANPCMVRGFAIGKARLHVTCTPAKSMEAPIEEIPRVEMPIASCSGSYDYFHQCIDDEPEIEVSKNRVIIEEGYIEISGGSPDSGFWSSVFDFLAIAAPIALAYFGL